MFCCYQFKENKYVYSILAIVLSKNNRQTIQFSLDLMSHGSFVIMSQCLKKFKILCSTVFGRKHLFIKEYFFITNSSDDLKNLQCLRAGCLI